MEHETVLKLDQFAWEAIQHESAKQGVSLEDLVAFAVLYYIADCDSGRIARRITPAEPRRETAGA